MISNIDENYMMDINRIVQDLKNLLDSISDKFSHVRFNKGDSLDDLVEMYSKDAIFLNKLNLIKKLTDDIS